MRRAAASSAGWQCPDCGRRFARRTREHSCNITAVEEHLEKTTPEVRAVYQALRPVLDALGPHDLIPLKTMITLSNGSAFGGLRFTRSKLELGFILPRRVDHPRLHGQVRMSARATAHHVSLTTPTEVDAEVAAWLKEAYQLGRSGGRRGRSAATAASPTGRRSSATSPRPSRSRPATRARRSARAPSR